MESNAGPTVETEHKQDVNGMVVATLAAVVDEVRGMRAVCVLIHEALRDMC